MKKESSGFSIFKFILWIILIVVIIWIFKGCFGGSSEVANTNQSANENVNGETNVNAENLDNENIDSSLNQSTDFDLDNCTSIFSRGQNRKEITLTFNAASKTSNLTTLMDILKTSNVPASFFFTGELAEESANEINNVASQGFSIYNLSYSYAHVANLSADELSEELSKTEAAVKEATGVSTKPFFRPPYGETGGEVFETAIEEGYCPVTWTVDAFDWDTDRTAEEAKNRVLDSLKDGTIVVMQVGTSLVPEFLQDLINEVKNQGYEFVDLATILTP